MIGKSSKLLTFLVIIIFIHGGDTWGRSDIVPGSRYVSGRGAAMGDAAIPVVDDAAGALFYQPAALAKLRGGVNSEPLNLSFEGNTGYLGAYNLNFYKVTDLQAYKGTLITNMPDRLGVGAALLPNFSMKGVAFGALAQTRLSSYYRDGWVTYRSKYEFVPAVGLGFNLAKGIIRLGYSGQWVNKVESSRTVEVRTTPNLSYRDRAYQGSGISHNVGFALTWPFQYLPAINIVARNVAGTKYKSFGLLKLSSNSIGAPPEEKMSIDLAASIEPKIHGATYLNLVFQVRDFLNTSNYNFLGRAALGAEFVINHFFFIRGGWGSGYGNAGFGIRTNSAEFSLAYYTEELGTSYQQEGDTKVMLQYQFRPF